ncbi:MAG: pyruvate carboxylase [Verrucomicrobiota bacterium]
MTPPFHKLLVANRSEIAVRIFRAATELGIRTVALYAKEDRFAVHRFKADEAYQLSEHKGPVGAYLDIESVIGIAKERGVDAIHPGYGFLSENAEFARACQENDITFIGPDKDLLLSMGDKTAARAVADRAQVPVLQGTEDAISDPQAATEVAQKIGFPLIIKAAFGGGGRGMRVVREPEQLPSLLSEAQTEAANAFGNPAVFLERFIERAKHIEVQIVGDQHGQVYHLHERDCSVQRRHQKVVEIAPSVGISETTRLALCDAAVRIAREVGYYNAGTVEFLVDAESEDWFFIEMNPRVQVEHTVTEQITGIDIVRSQILVAAGHRLDGPEIDFPPQDQIQRNGYAIQCRITTEDPENGFAPDIGRILTYRSPAGMGIRLDGAMGTNGMIISPFYDSLLVKLTCQGRHFHHACDRMIRSLREFRIRGVKTNIPFLENVIHDPTFRAGHATTRLIDQTPSLFQFKKRRDRATKLLNYLGDVIVNGNPHAKNWKPEAPFREPRLPTWDHRREPPAGTRQKLLQMGAPGFAAWIRAQQPLLLTDTTLRDAHQSLFATRMRTADMLPIAGAIAHQTPQLFSLEMWGGATFDTALRFLKEDPFERLRQLRKWIPNICFQMLFRGSNAVGYSNYPDNVVRGFVQHSAEAGMDIFRIFDSLNYLPNLQVAMEAVQDTHALCEGTLCYTGNILDPQRTKYGIAYYLKLARELERMGAHTLCIKDMAGLCRPYAAEALVKALRQEIGLPIHFHTHDTSGLNAASILKAAESGVDIADAALASLSGSTSQPNLNSIVAALQNTERETGLDLSPLDDFSDYWEDVRKFYQPFDTSDPHGTAEVYLHEMPGGQFTNLKEQAEAMGLGARWKEVAKTYAEVNQLFGDIVKVTPSSKVVGDMTMFLVSRGMKAADVVNLPEGTNFPESVIDMLGGGLGQPEGGWPPEVQRVILGGKPPREGRPGDHAPAIDLQEVGRQLSKELGHQASQDEIYSFLMYPQVFRDFVQTREQYGDLSVLPTPAYFYGPHTGEEFAASIDEGKTLLFKRLHVSSANSDGFRTVIFEVNGIPRHIQIADRSIAPETKVRQKADPQDPDQIGAPMPGMINSIAVTVGQKVEKGDTLLTLEAMKMFTSVTSPRDGVVESVEVKVSENVDSKDLLVVLGAES